MLNKSHFEGHGNLTKGQRRGTDQILSELIPVALISTASVGGNATETIAVPGLKATDTIIAFYQKTAGGGLAVAVKEIANQIDGFIDVTWDVDPGVGAVLVFTVQNAAG